VSQLSLFPRILFCSECGRPVEGIRWWNPFQSKVRCCRCSENWSEVVGWH
jgi:predicted amidophosphoribosyltransferase